MVFTLVLLLYLLPFLLLVWLIRLGTKNLADNKKKSVRKITNYGFILAVLFILSGGNIFEKIEFGWRCSTQAGYEVYETLDIGWESFSNEDGSVDWRFVENMLRFELDTVYLDKAGRLKELITEYYFEDRLIAKRSSFNLSFGGIWSGLGVGDSCPKNIDYQLIYEEIFQGEER